MSIEGCKGCILNYKCAVCEHYTCSKCFIDLGLEKPVNHKCNPDMVATVEMIKKDSKSVPNVVLEHQK